LEPPSLNCVPARGSGGGWMMNLSPATP
jgi:hypothetical protein